MAAAAQPVWAELRLSGLNILCRGPAPRRLGCSPMPACIRWVAGQPPGMAVHGCRALWVWAGCPAGRKPRNYGAAPRPFCRSAGQAAHAAAAGARHGRRRARAAPWTGTFAAVLPRPLLLAQHPAASSGAGQALGRAAFRRRVPHATIGLRGLGRIRGRCELASSKAGALLWPGDLYWRWRAREPRARQRCAPGTHASPRGVPSRLRRGARALRHGCPPLSRSALLLVPARSRRGKTASWPGKPRVCCVPSCRCGAAVLRRSAVWAALIRRGSQVFGKQLSGRRAQPGWHLGVHRDQEHHRDAHQRRAGV